MSTKPVAKSTVVRSGAERGRFKEVIKYFQIKTKYFDTGLELGKKNTIIVKTMVLLRTTKFSRERDTSYPNHLAEKHLLVLKLIDAFYPRQSVLA